jgi:NADH/NAD ratio-sensing transcriptional regulator Rex
MTGKADPAIVRLTELLTLLPQLEEEGETLNSRLIGRHLNITPDSVRKDISRLNREGRTGGYDALDLSEEIRKTLGLTDKGKVAIAGLGPLGIHIMGLLSVSTEVKLTAAFDGKLNLVERLDAPVDLFPSWELSEIIGRTGIEVGIITTAPEETDKTYLRMKQGGVKAVLNLSGRYLPHEKEGPVVKNINIGAMLLELLCRI